LISTLERLRLPPGVSIEMPPPHRIWTPQRLRLMAIYLCLPLLMAALAICRLDSWFLGLAALGPLVLGLSVAIPVVASSSSGLREMGLLALAMALLACLPLSLETAAAAHARKLSPLAVGKGYRWLVRRVPSAAIVTAAWAGLLLLPTLGASADREPWALPLRAASVLGIASVWAVLLWLPLLLRAADQVRFRDRRAERARSHPRRWREPGPAELETRNLAKVYGNGFQALAQVSFRITPGLVGLLGPNGAGKSTLLRMLCGLLEPSRGQVLFRGAPVCPENLPRYRRLVGFLPQSFEAYPGLSVEQFLEYWALELGFESPRERRREIEIRLQEVGLASVAGRRVRDLSGGMRRRIGIARALLGSPPILIVDEPTTGLDVASRNHLRESLLQVAEDRIILFSTHIASDLSAAASRILVLCGGRLLFDGPSSELVRRAEGRVFQTVIDDREMRELSTRFRITTRVRTLEGIRVRAVAPPGIEPAGRPVTPDLEEAYLARMLEAGVGTAVPGTGVRRGVGARLLDLEGW
ncbi:MAG: ABC transporter ATP-binding protein, partial [Holophagales bacterium]|nr:ABC transporter ATP-binding protein [Holophagales bacterium]